MTGMVRGAIVTSEKEMIMNVAVSGTNLAPQRIVDHEMLTVKEAAQFLRVPVSTIYNLARLGQLPSSKVGKHWRFTRRGLLEWVQRSLRGQ